MGRGINQRWRDSDRLNSGKPVSPREIDKNQAHDLALSPAPEAQEAREYRLFDSQWVNVVNHAGCYRDMNKEDAVAQAVKLTEQAMAANINDCKWPRPRKADAALALPAQGEGNNG